MPSDKIWFMPIIVSMKHVSQWHNFKWGDCYSKQLSLLPAVVQLWRQTLIGKWSTCTHFLLETQLHNRKHITRTLKTSFLVNFNVKEHHFTQAVQPNIGKFITNFVFNNTCSSITICTAKYKKNLLQNLCFQTHIIVLQAKYYKQCSHSISNTVDLYM